MAVRSLKAASSSALSCTIDQLHAQHAHGVVVHVVRVGREDDFALEAGQIRQPLHALRIAAGNRRRREVRDGGAAARRSRCPTPRRVSSARRLLTPSISSSMWTKLRDASSIARLTSGSVCRPGDDGERAAGVDHRAHADRAVHAGSEFQRGRHRLPYAAAECLRGGQPAAAAEEIAAADSGPRCA